MLSFEIGVRRKLRIGDKVDILVHPNEGIVDLCKHKHAQKLPRIHGGVSERMTPLSDALNARRQLREIKSRLSEQQTNAYNSRGDVDKMRHHLHLRQLQLQQSFTQFNYFAGENENKRKRARVKIEIEGTGQKKQNEEVAKLKEELMRLYKMEKQLEEKVNDYHLYRNFLQNAVDDTPAFSDIREILMRHDTLVDTRKELGTQQAAKLCQVQQTREQLTIVATMQARSIMQLNTQLAHLRLRRELASDNFHGWHNTISRISTFAANQQLAITQVHETCWRLYSCICRTLNKSVSLHKSQTEQQLAYVAQQIQQLQVVTEIIRKKLQMRTPLSLVQSATSSI